MSKINEAQVPAGSGGKAVILGEKRMVTTGAGYTLDRRVLGAVLYTVKRKHVPVQTYVPVSHQVFFLTFDGNLLNIGCYHFSATATKKIFRWSQKGL